MAKRNLIGRTFGYLVVTKYDEEMSRQKGRPYWSCLCDCGRTASKREDKLLGGYATQCNCGKHVDLVGKRFGTLTVISRAYKIDEKGNVYWNVKCDCGTVKTLRTSDLKKRKSCGCLTIERMKKESSTYQSYEKQRENALKANEKTIRDGINFGILNGKLFKNNTSGHKGVFWDRGAWRAVIGYKKKYYNLLRDKNINNCIEIREEAAKAINDGCFEEFYASIR